MLHRQGASRRAFARAGRRTVVESEGSEWLVLALLALLVGVPVLCRLPGAFPAGRAGHPAGNRRHIGREEEAANYRCCAWSQSRRRIKKARRL